MFCVIFIYLIAFWCFFEFFEPFFFVVVVVLICFFFFCSCVFSWWAASGRGFEEWKILF